MCNTRTRYVPQNCASHASAHRTSQTAAEKALELHDRELDAGLPLNVYISNPERKKERTDQDAQERELYVAGLSKFTTKQDLEKVFKTVRAYEIST